MQLVLHAPFGSRINRAWGLALRKKFCQGFNFELQAAATEEGIILSLGDVAFVPAGRSVPLPAPEHRARDAGAGDPAVADLRDALALEHHARARGAAQPRRRAHPEPAAAHVRRGPAAGGVPRCRRLPGQHPGRARNAATIRSSTRRCAMRWRRRSTATGLEETLTRLVNGEIGFVARDTPEPSVLSHELLNSAVYTFLDDAPLEERRTRAVYTRRATEVRSADDLGALDPAAIERVRQEAWPVANTADEMYDALMVAGYIKDCGAGAALARAARRSWVQRAVKKGDCVVRAGAPGRRAAGASREPAGGARPGHRARARHPGGRGCSAGARRPGTDPARPLFARRDGPASGATGACSRASIATR